MRKTLEVQSRRLLTGLFLLTLIAAPGCGESGPKTGTVSGTVTVNGAPLAVGFVNFEDPARGIGASATVRDGTYQFESPLNIGDYKVFVQPPSLIPSEVTGARRPKNEIPNRYLQSETSPLKVTVTEGPNQFELPLEK